MPLYNPKTGLTDQGEAVVIQTLKRFAEVNPDEFATVCIGPSRDTSELNQEGVDQCISSMVRDINSTLRQSPADEVRNLTAAKLKSIVTDVYTDYYTARESEE